MEQQRNFGKYTVDYGLAEKGDFFVVSITKTGAEGTEINSFAIKTSENDAVSLFKKLVKCGVTPISLGYIMEDEGYITGESEVLRIAS